MAGGVHRRCRAAGDGNGRQGQRRQHNDGALQQAPENKTLVSCGKTALVDGESRQFAETVRIEVTTTLEEEGFANLKPTQATDPLTIESVDEWVGGLITLRDPKKKKRRFACFNVAPANVPKDSLRFTIGHKCTVLWEGRQVKFRSDDAEEDGSAQETTGLLSSLMGKLSFRRASKGKAREGAVDARRSPRPSLSSRQHRSSPKPTLAIQSQELVGQGKRGDGGSECLSDGDADADDDFCASRRSMLRHSELEAEDEAAGIVDASVLRGSLAERQLEHPSGNGFPLACQCRLTTSSSACRQQSLANTTGAESFIKKLRVVLSRQFMSRVVDALHQPELGAGARVCAEEDAQAAGSHATGSRAAPSPVQSRWGAHSQGQRRSQVSHASIEWAPSARPTAHGCHGGDLLRGHDRWRGRDGGRQQVRDVKQGFLLRKLRHDPNGAGATLFSTTLVSYDGIWMQSVGHGAKGDEHSVSKAMAACDPHTYGQISLRFVAPELCGQLRAKDVECEVYEEPEVKRMLPSCVVFELHAGREVLRLAWHKSIVDEWLKELTAQCVINYQKSPIFSDRQLKIHWMDGVARSLTIGENTTAVDLVRRLCRARKTGGDSMPRGRVARGGNMSAEAASFIGGDGSGAVPVIHDSSEWAIFERQRHVNRAPSQSRPTTGGASSATHPLARGVAHA